MAKPKHCATGTHVFKKSGRGKRYCTKCPLVPCDVGECDLSLHPVPLKHFPPENAAVCRSCGERTVWSPMKGQKLTDPHVMAHDPDEHAKKHGHPIRDLGKENAALVADLLEQAARASKAKPTPKAPPVPPLPKPRKP